MFSYSTGYYVSPPDDQYLKFKNRCSLLGKFFSPKSLSFIDKTVSGYMKASETKSVIF
jgi:hypothetical protein